MQSDSEIIAQVKAGNSSAFAQLYKKYAGYALRTATAVTKSQASAADAVQETFIKVYTGISSFDPTRPFRPWFYTILLNECNRIMKKNTRLLPIMDSPEKSFEPASQDFYRFEVYEDLYTAVRNLPEVNRIPLVLKYLNDFTEKEIAEILGLNINTVKSRLFKGRQKLKKVLEKHTEGREIYG